MSAEEHFDKMDAMTAAMRGELPPVLSGRGPCEPAAPLGALALATCSLPVSSVHLLLSRWHAEAAKGHLCAKAWGSPGNPAPFHQGWAQALEHCIEELRAEVEAAKVRQPEENTKTCHGPEAKP